MINKDTYKRLTKKGGYTKDLDLKQELGYSYIYTRLSELEDKIMDGRLVELPCKVGDKILTSDTSKCCTNSCILKKRLYKEDIIKILNGREE